MMFVKYLRVRAHGRDALNISFLHIRPILLLAFPSFSSKLTSGSCPVGTNVTRIHALISITANTEFQGSYASFLRW